MRLIFALFACSAALHAAANPMDILTASGAPSGVVAVVMPGKAETWRLGPAAGTALIRIGSTSKLLAAHVALQMEGQGKLKLDDILAPAVPVTLRQLITHTGGLPRDMPGEYPANAPDFTWPTAADRSHWLAQYKPASSAPAAAYSNLGYDLLTDALATRAGKPYPELLRELITGPLGMKDTTSSPTPLQCARLMRGDEQFECADTSATAGNGGLYSSADDMAIWMRYMLGLDAAHKLPAKALDTLVLRSALSSVTGLDKGGPAHGIGFGWVALAPADGLGAIMQKTGGGGGFMSYMAIAPDEKIGVFVAVTRMDQKMMAGLVAQSLALVRELAAKNRKPSPAGPASTSSSR